MQEDINKIIEGTGVVKENNIDKSLSIVLNQDVITTLRANELNVNHMCVLLALYEDYLELLDIYDSKNTWPDALMSYQYLHRLGFVDSSTDGQIYKISEKGIELIELIKTKFYDEIEGEVEIVQTEDKGLTFDAFVEKYIEIFPKQRLPSGMPARGNKPDIIKKMKSFLREYKFSRDEILKATQLYVERFSASNYLYMATAEYFIHKKDRGSLLASEINALNDGTDETRNNGFSIA